jgi:integrase
MPLKLKPPRPGKSPYYYVRGSYLGTRLDRSTGTGEKRVAKLVLKKWKTEIENGVYKGPRVAAQSPEWPTVPTFATAALAYMRAGGERKHLDPILAKIGRMPLPKIDQILLDTVAKEIYPNATAATLNRQFYTPVSAVLKRAGIETSIKRPKGWRGQKTQSWLEPDQAFTLFEAADELDTEFGLFLRFLLYTGMRLGEALNIRLGDVDLSRSFLYLPKTKNSHPRPVYLPPILINALRAQKPRQARPKAVRGQRLPNGAAGRSQADAEVPFLERHKEAKLFRFHAGGRLRAMLAMVMERAQLSFPRRQRGFHLFCHTYGTWMHRYGGLDTFGLTRTHRWADPRSADRYKHTQISEEARRADLLPTDEKYVENRVRQSKSLKY